MPDLFLSYSREDQAVARRFAEGFERAGLSVWWDQSLNPGEAFDQVTERALDEASAVIVLWSKASVSSRWVRAEATQANTAGRLLPVMVESCKRPIMFELTHTADLSEWQGNAQDAAWQTFVASVRRFVERAAPAGADGLPMLSAPPLPPPRVSPKERLLMALSMLRSATVWLASLLRQFGGRLAFGLICAALAAFIAWRVHPRPTPQVARFSIELQDTPITGVPGGFAVSPDGQRIVYASSQLQLYSRRLDTDESTLIPGASRAVGPFFSPDGRTVAFFGLSDTKLKASDFSTVRELADLIPVPGFTGAWDDQDRIYYGQQQAALGLSRVAGVGGVPESFAKPGDYQDLQFPAVLPGGSWVLFTAKKSANWSEADIVAQHVASGERKVVLKGGYFPRYLPTGHLLFVRGGTLYAVAFDAKRLATRGSEVPMVPNIWTDESNGFSNYAVSASGTLVYLPGTGAVLGVGSNNRLVRVGSDGQVRPLSPELRGYTNPRASPNGLKVAVEVTGDDRRTHIWVLDIQKGKVTQLTFAGEEDRFPVWTPNSREVLFTSRRGTDFAIYRMAADGSGAEREVTRGSPMLAPSDVHGEKTLIYQDNGAGGQRDIFALDLEAEGAAEPQVVLATADDESSARISPDGKWLAYVASAARSAGAFSYRVYARPFRNAAEGGQRAISEGLAVDPEWSADNEIHYIGVDNNSVDSLWSVQVEVTPTTITPIGRRELFPFAPRFVGMAVRDYGKSYDLLPRDGGFVLVMNGAAAAPGDAANAVRARANVVVNWAEELKQRVPVE
jgi:Tol biopolymer transport system component